MKLWKIKRDFKKFDGGVLKFQDRKSKKKYYFEMSYQQFKPVYKALKHKRRNQFFVLSSDGRYLIFKDFRSLKTSFNIEDNQIGRLIQSNGMTYGICHQTMMLDLLENMMSPEKDRIKAKQDIEYIKFGDFNHDNQDIHDFNSIKKSNESNRELLPRLKQKQVDVFDWAEAYEEGLRIFDDDQDEAEAYADDMKYKKTGQY